MSRLLRLLPERLQDDLMHSRTLRSICARAAVVVAGVVPGHQRKLRWLTRALEMSGSLAFHQSIASRLLQQGFFDQRAPWVETVKSSGRYREHFGRRSTLNRSVILKAPGADGEKGLLLMTFEYNWARLCLGLSEEELAWMAANFNFVFSASWSPTDYAVLGLVVACFPGTLFVQSCNYAERQLIEAFHPRLRCLETLPCDWISPGSHNPKPFAERSIDLLMVANWGRFKRHWEFFETLAQLPADLKVHLIGQPAEGRDSNFIRQLARQKGVPQQLTIHERLPIHEVAALQSDARVSVIMSRREGCCVAAVESLMAGCALAMRDDAHVGPVEYINSRTGVRLRPGHLAEDLQNLLQRAPQTEPREWCLQNASGDPSWQKLNRLIREHEIANARPWTQDLAVPSWRPHPTFRLVEEQQRLRPIYQELHSKFPRVFAEDLAENSWK
ncbi:glycosyltransferase [Prosthecobacter sp.]|uniref:glycosyltransferase n=1 Tax=Prosthecobacter sp. TaxID=1965333 RepID=UPI0037837C30